MNNIQPGQPIRLCRRDLFWETPSDLPDYCGACPCWQGFETQVPGMPADTGGICALRNMNKDRYADAPKACLRLFKKTFNYPEDQTLVVVWKDSYDD